MLELLWLENIDSKISFWYYIIDFSTGKLVYMSKEMLESDLKIYAILVDKFKRDIWENSK